MDEQNPSPLVARWRALSLPSKVVLGVIVFLVALVVLTFLRSVMSTSMYGSDSATIRNPLSMPSSSGVASNKASSRGAMEYDAYEESATMPYPTPGGTGSYEESEYETRSYSATIKTSDYDETLAVIDSWKPLPHVMFESANRGERSAYYSIKVESARAEEVLSSLKALSPTDLNQQTEVIKKQLLAYTTRLDVLTRQEKLFADMLDQVNAAYDELVNLSKNAGDVKTLASVIDDKTKYINQLSQQRLTVTNQLEVIAQQKAELADRIAYVYFDITVNKYQFIDGDQIKDSWVARVQTFVRDANRTLQDMTLGIIELLLWLVGTILQVLVFYVITLVVVKYGYRATRKFWQS